MGRKIKLTEGQLRQIIKEAGIIDKIKSGAADAWESLTGKKMGIMMRLFSANRKFLYGDPGLMMSEALPPSYDPNPSDTDGPTETWKKYGKEIYELALELNDPSILDPAEFKKLYDQASIWNDPGPFKVSKPPYYDRKGKSYKKWNAQKAEHDKLTTDQKAKAKVPFDKLKRLLNDANDVIGKYIRSKGQNLPRY